jgi:transcriptional regulator with XRE-family HTH domain
VIDQDTQEVIDRLDAAVAASGLSMRQFAGALGTSPSRFSSYRTGRVAPSAAFLMRAERIADALRQARRDNIPAAIEAVGSILRAINQGDEDWTFALCLEARDRVRDILGRHESLAAAWEIQPSTDLDDPWRALLAAFVNHEFIEAGLAPPKWTAARQLSADFVLDTPRLSEREIRRQTPDWLAERSIFIVEKDLITL